MFCIPGLIREPGSIHTALMWLSCLWPLIVVNRFKPCWRIPPFPKHHVCLNCKIYYDLFENSLDYKYTVVFIWHMNAPGKNIPLIISSETSDPSNWVIPELLSGAVAILLQTCIVTATFTTSKASKQVEICKIIINLLCSIFLAYYLFLIIGLETVITKPWSLSDSFRFSSFLPFIVDEAKTETHHKTRLPVVEPLTTLDVGNEMIQSVDLWYRSPPCWCHLSMMTL